MKNTIIPIVLSFGPSHVTVAFKDVRRLSLRVNRDKITVSAPLFTKISTIETFVNNNLDWIEKHLLLEKDDDIYMLGKRYSVTVAEGKSKVAIIDDAFVVYAPDGNIDKAKKTLLSRWRRDSKEYFLSELERAYDEVKTVFDVAELPRLVVCSARSYWGKCFYKNNLIKLSYYLYQADPDTIRYVMLHELCHFRHHGHDRSFYEALSKVYPDVKGAKKRLKNYHSKLWFDIE